MELERASLSESKKKKKGASRAVRRWENCCFVAMEVDEFLGALGDGSDSPAPQASVAPRQSSGDRGGVEDIVLQDIMAATALLQKHPRGGVCVRLLPARHCIPFNGLFCLL